MARDSTPPPSLPAIAPQHERRPLTRLKLKPGPQFKKDSPLRRATFLENLRQGYSPAKSAEAIGVSTTQVWNWRHRDAKFAQDWLDAVRDGIDKLEDEAYRRAHDGCTRPVYQGGVRVGELQEYSDSLMVVMLKGRRPEVYGDRQQVDVKGEIEHTISLKIFGDGGAPTKVIDISPSEEE